MTKLYSTPPCFRRPKIRDVFGFTTTTTPGNSFAFVVRKQAGYTTKATQAFA
ncbi:hypothetical protein [Rudanella paleaurantiibacter]|uniref:hypothetical protein n=1 Tax=Rudanella paleaurantiibacter TaxID=2614655 RepID=UPI001629A4C3|nr:hypothetical protein [Rudanella paleaurantiibacter]